jgi:anti-sigma regulatory factor (Ser/Thr protein kinase)
VADFIAGVCAAGDVPRKTCLRLTLVVEELFTNTIVHGHGRDTEAPIHLGVDICDDSIALTYEDTAPPHDPFATVRVPDDTAAVEDRPIGGLGVWLIAAMAARIQYARVGGRNRISLVMPTGRSSP